MTTNRAIFTGKIANAPKLYASSPNGPHFVFDVSATDSRGLASQISVKVTGPKRADVRKAFFRVGFGQKITVTGELVGTHWKHCIIAGIAGISMHDKEA